LSRRPERVPHFRRQVPKGRLKVAGGAGSEVVVSVPQSIPQLLGKRNRHLNVFIVSGVDMRLQSSVNRCEPIRQPSPLVQSLQLGLLSRP
jgi:hypothetical protein